MCRHLAYVGEPVDTATLLFGAPHSLARQAQHPRHQPGAVDNPDGWGLGWWNDGAVTRYRTLTPIWDDDAYAPVTASAWIGAARWASPGSKLDECSVAPFIDGSWLLSLNGLIEGFYDGPRDALLERCSPARRDALVTDTDTELCFALLLDRLDAGASPPDALATVIKAVEAESAGRFNFLLGDGVSMVATAVGNSLFVRDDPTMIASEPLDDHPAWRQVPDRSLVLAGADHLEVQSL